MSEFDRGCRPDARAPGMTEVVAAAGAGRMGRGLAVVFAYAGYPVRLIDLKAREDAAVWLENAEAEIRSTLKMLVSCGMIADDDIERIASRVSYETCDQAQGAISGSDVIFEGVPETLDAKRHALSLISEHAQPNATIASSTSTILSDELQAMVKGPERFLNAHWLNPAFLVPLVEISPGAKTDPEVTARLVALLNGIGKVPVIMKASPGFIVPRIQALAMNE
ncbi:MAG: 3-hydroxyacyl-CoA dehydrogenase NAD-binding domain-containing protein, partial [Pseudomonadota bacterium]